MALVLCAMTCEGQLAPVIRNDLTDPLELEVAYSNGFSDTWTSLPGGRSFAPVEGVGIDRLVVRSADRTLYELGKEDLYRLRATLPPDTRVVWSISTEGVRPLPFTD